MFADELRQLAVDLGEVPGAVVPQVRKAVEVTARHIKDEWASELKAVTNRSFGAVPYTVDYDMGRSDRETSFAATGNVSSVQAEIGPNLGKKQGPFAGWFEEGAVDGVPATHAGAESLEKWRPDFEEGLQKAIADGLKKAIG